MNKIETLIKELCPNGVEWKELCNICTVKTGKGINKNFIQANPGEFPVVNSGKDPLGFVNIFNTVDDPIGITSRGAGVGYVSWNEGNYFRGNLNYSATIKDKSKLSARFLYFYLKNNSVEIEKLCTFNGIPALNKENLEKLTIPIPPLEIQEEIVKILDKFTDYVTELTTELTLRQKQYHYYRDKLLAFDNEEVEWKTLGDIGKVSMCKRILKKDTSQDGEIPFYKIGTFGSEPNSFISRSLFEEYKSKFSYPKKGDILISASGTIGRTVIFDGVDSYYQDSNIVWLEHDEKIILNKYLYYFYRTNPWKISIGGTIPRLYNEDIKKTKIPVPPLTAQNKIINYLDNLEKIVNDVNYSLPKEIELRQKQYEFYRDKLLSFD